jgi:transcriptional regulator with XRE-family HTH domain
MQTTIELLDTLRKARGLTSDYQLAQLLGTTRQRISNYRTGTNTLGDDMALQVAELLKISPDYVLACMAAERAKGKDAKREWARLARKLAPATLGAILAGCALTFAPLPGLAPAASAAPMYIMLNALLLAALMVLGTKHAATRYTA